jgi:hypothetical protein
MKTNHQVGLKSHSSQFAPILAGWLVRVRWFLALAHTQRYKLMHYDMLNLAHDVQAAALWARSAVESCP